MLDCLKPDDPRIEHKYAAVEGGHTYHYMVAQPKSGKPTATVFLIHGWPDLGMGWRFQVPYLLSLNMQVVVPDMLGYGRSSAPDAFEEYSLKKMSAHMAQIIKSVTDQPIILGGHDWGAIFVWRMTQYYPELIRSVFAICVPYAPPTPKIMTLEQVIQRLPNFRYQQQLASGKAEQIVAEKTPERLRAFLNGMYGGKTPDGKILFTTDDGVREDRIDSIGPSPMVPPEWIDFYVQEYSLHDPVALHGPCNWYRTRLVNGADEQKIAGNGFKFPMPAMLLMAENDAALPLHMAKGQEQYFAAGLKMEVLKGCSHWAMVQKPAEVNQFIGEFVKQVLGDGVKASL